MLTIIHLSDIHFSETRDNYLLNRSDLLFKSIISEVRGSSHAIILVSGDTANYGIESEYSEVAFPFFLKMKSSIEKEISNLKFDFIFIPGNHDCDFSNSEEMEIREDLINSIAQNPQKAEKNSYIKKIITQEPFNNFKSIFHDDWNFCKLKLKNPLADKILINIDNKSVILNLFNSAWISTIQEKAGRMYFPLDHLKFSEELIGDINISVIHHPTHWLEPNNKREVESLLQKESDIIISGHEHVPSTVTLTDWNTREVVFIEGAALQEHGSSHISGYNVINIDILSNTFSLKNLNWDSNMYTVETKEEVWRSISKTMSVQSQNHAVLKPSELFEDFLKDIAIPLTHPRKESLELEDIYVFPNIEERIYQNNAEVISDITEISEILNTEKEAHLLFSGDKDSGKTALGKMLFKYFYENQYFPIYVSGLDIIPAIGRNIKLLIANHTKSVYGDGKENIYNQLLRKERILIIDDWHKCKLNSQSKSRFLEEANKFFKQVIFLSEVSDTAASTLELTSKHDEYEFRHFEMKDFGHVKRNEFVEKWILLGQSETLENDQLIRECEKIKRILQPILNQSFVPKFPLYLLIILKTIESGTPHNLDKSSNGYYFEILIKDSLSSIEIENNETDKIYQYLTDFAYELLKVPDKTLTLQEWKNYHEQHLDSYDMTSDQLMFKDLQRKFETEKVIKNLGSAYGFYYPYVFYFFVAQYFARNLHENEVKERIQNLCRNLHISENANIVMFLTHLSKDQFVKNEVMNAAQNIFKDIAPLKLESDVSIINELIDVLSPIVIEDVNVRDHRKKLNQEMDRIEYSNEEQKRNDEFKSQIASTSLEKIDSNDEDSDMNSAIAHIDMTNKGLKMLDIIGQILRNYYGSMKGVDKLQLCEEHYRLGLRISYSFIQDLNNQSENITNFISSMILEKGIEDQEKAEKVAKRFIYSISGFISYNLIGKISTSIGTPDLNVTFEKVKENIPYTSVELINLFIKIEYYDQFPYAEVSRFYQKNINNKISVHILRLIVKRYLYMFETSRSEKQRICSTVSLLIDPKEQLQISNNK